MKESDSMDIDHKGKSKSKGKGKGKGAKADRQDKECYLLVTRKPRRNSLRGGRCESGVGFAMDIDHKGNNCAIMARS